MFAVNFAGSAQGVLLSSYIDFYGLRSASQGLISTAQSIGCVLICVVILVLAGRVRRHDLVLILVSACMVSMLLLGAKPAFFVLLMIYALFGVGYAGLSNVNSSLTSELFGSGPVAMGLLHAAFGLGGLAGPLLLQFLLTGAGLEWNIVCICVSGAVLIILGYYAVALKFSKPMLLQLNEKQEKVTFSGIKSFLGDRRCILLLVAAFGYMAFQNGVNIWIARYTNIELGAEELGALTLSLFWVGNTVARLAVPRLRLSTETVFSAGCLLSAALFALGLLTESPVIMLICVVLCGIFSGASIPQLYSLGCKWTSQGSLIPTSIVAVTLFLSSMITAPLTAKAASFGMVYGMLTIAVYAFIGGAAMLPIEVARRKANRSSDPEN